jgi:hypothetical protein
VSAPGSGKTIRKTWIESRLQVTVQDQWTNVFSGKPRAILEEQLISYLAGSALVWAQSAQHQVRLFC